MSLGIKTFIIFNRENYMNNYVVINGVVINLDKVCKVVIGKRILNEVEYFDFIFQFDNGNTFKVLDYTRDMAARLLAEMFDDSITSVQSYLNIVPVVQVTVIPECNSKKEDKE